MLVYIYTCREANKQLVKRHFSKLKGGESMAAEKGRISKKGHEKGAEGLSCWVPHPRTGIYVPKGHESVIDDVPDGAASFNQTYWFREVDGVEEPDHHILSKRHFPTNNL